MTKHDPIRLFHDILRYANEGVLFTEGMTLEEFLEDTKTLRAVARVIEVIGEAAKRMPAEVREQHVEIPWKHMTGMRDMLAHGYDIIDPEILWYTTRRDLPNLIPLVERIIDSFGEK